MTNDQNKAGTNPISNKQLGTAPVPLIMPPARRSSQVSAGKSAKSRKEGQQQDKDQLATADGQPLYDMTVVPEEGAVERARESAEAAMSARRGKEEEDETGLDKSADASGEEAPLLLAQASTGNSGSTGSNGAGNLEAPVSVGEELLRQAAPLPGSPQKAGPDWLESLLGKDWKLPVAIGGGALALLGLAAASGGGGSSGGGSATPAGATPAANNDVAPPPPPSNTWTLTVTPAAGKFEAGATVRASAQKWVGGNWQEVAATTTVDRVGRMSIKVDKSQVSPDDMLRVVISDSGSGADHRDEVAGMLTLGAIPMIALIGHLSSDQQVTVNPLTTLAATRIGQDLSAATMDAVHAAVAKAFGIGSGDLVHVLPTFLAGGGSSVITADSQNYGLALGVLAGVAQAYRAAGVDSDQALGSALTLLAGAFETQEGKLFLNLDKIRSSTFTKANNTTAQVGLDEGAARLFKAAAVEDTGANGGQIPYVTIDAHKEDIPAGQKPAPGADVTLSAANFTDGLTLKVNTAASAKAGDTLRIEFIKLDANGSPVPNAKPFTYDYVLTQKDVDQVGSTAGNFANKGGGYFNLVVPTHIDDSSKFNPDNGARAAQPSSTDPGTFLLPVTSADKTTGASYYNAANSGDTQFQLRATGSALGFASAGGRISVASAPVVLKGVPAGGTFNGGDAASANTISIDVTLPTKIFWDHPPTLAVKIGADTFTAICTNTTTSDVLHFSLVLSNASTSITHGKEGVVTIPDDALHFPPSTVITADGGATLFTFDSTGKWIDHLNNVVTVPISQALGVMSTNLDTGYHADTKPPADPILELEAPPMFDADGFRPADKVPEPGKLNAIFNSNPQVANSVVTSKIEQNFSIKVASGFNPDDNGATVKLYVSAAGVSESILATVTVDDKGVAHFTEANYKKEVVDKLNSAAKGQGAADGLLVSLSAQIIDRAGNNSRKVPLKFPDGAGAEAKFTLDTTAPVAPTRVQLDPGSNSDTGRDGAGLGGTKSDSITALSKPSLRVEGGSVGSVIQVWADAAGSQLIGKAVVNTFQDTATSTNGAVVALTEALREGLNTVYTTITDQAGNRGPAKSVDLTYLKPIDLSASADLRLDITSPKPASGFYRLGDVIEVSVNFKRPVFGKNGAQQLSSLFVDLIPNKSDGSPALPDEIVKATYVSGEGTDTLKFRYTVQQDIDKTNTGTFTVSKLINQGNVLEDIAGSTVVTTRAAAVAGQEIKIDTIAPRVPVISLPADVAAVPDSPTFGRGTATNEGLSVTAENGSKLALSFTKGGVQVLNKTVIATGAAQNVTFSEDDLNKLGQGDIAVTAVATDAAGNASVSSAALSFMMDTVAPMPMLVGAPIGIASGQPVTGVTNLPFMFIVNFGEVLKRTPTRDDFLATHGSITNVLPVNSGPANTAFQVFVTPAADVAAGNIELKLNPAAAPLSDKAGNLVVTGQTIATQAIDTLGPQITATADAGGAPVKAGEPVSFTVTLSEVVPAIYGNIGPSNFSASNGTVKTVTPIDGSGGLRYKVVVTPVPPAPSAGSTSADFDVGLNVIARGSDGVLRDALGNGARDALGLATQRIDVMPPQVSGLTVAGTVNSGSATPNYFHVGDTVTVSVSFNEAVTITGKPTVDIDVGGTVRQAVYRDMSGDKTMAFFDYTIAAGDNAATGIALPVNSIKLAGGSIKDVAGNIASLTAAAKPADASVKIDTLAPNVEEVKISSASVAPVTAGLYKAGATLTAAVRFSEEIQVDSTTGRPTLALKVGTNIRSAVFDKVDADHKTLLFNYQLQDGDNDAAGVTIPAAALTLNNARITDVSGNSAVINNSATQPNPDFKVDSTAPVVSTVVVSAAPAPSGGGSSGVYRAGDKIIGTVTFSEDVHLDITGGAPKLTLKIGANEVDADYTPVGNNNRTYNFSYTIGNNDRADAGVGVTANGLKLNNATFTDAAGNAAALAYAGVPANATVKVDNAAPSIVGFSATSSKTTLIIGDVLALKAKVSEALRGGSTLTVTLSNGGTAALEIDSSDPTQLIGNYTVRAGENAAAGGLKVTSVATTAKDLAGNALSTANVPVDIANSDPARPSITIDARQPAQPSAFQLDTASDAGSSSTDGLTNVTLPSFHFDGLAKDARVMVTARNGSGATLTLLDFVATAVSQTVAMSGAALADDKYTNVVVRQFSASGNASEPLALGKTSTSGSFEINTAAPGMATDLVFDDIQDTLTDSQYATYLTQANDAKTKGLQTRDYRTSIQQPRFDFKGGNDGDVAVLFRDMNNNNRFDSGDLVLGRKTIGADSVVQYQLGAVATEMKKMGHFVEVDAANALPNSTYADIKVVLQSAAGTFGAASLAAREGLQVFNNAPLPAVTEVSAAQGVSAGPTAARLLSFAVTGGKPGAIVKFTAERTDTAAGTPTVVNLGQGQLTADGKVQLDTSALNGSYSNFKAIQTYAGRDSNPVDVKSVGGNPLTMTWDHVAPTVTVALKPGAVARAGQPVELEFTFSETVTDFAQDDITATGGALGALAGTGLTRTATFTPTDGTVFSGSVKVNAGSYKDVADNLGAGSDAFNIAFNRPGTIQLSGMSNTNAPQVGETLRATVSDPDGNPTGPVSYKWTVGGTEVAGNNTATYLVTAADKTKPIKVSASYTDGAGQPDTAVSGNTGAVTGPNTPVQVRIEVNDKTIDPAVKTLHVGERVKVIVTDAEGVPAAPNYKWLDSGSIPQNKILDPVDFLVTQDMVGDLIHFTAKFTDRAGNEEEYAGERSVSYRIRLGQLPGTVSIAIYDEHGDPIDTNVKLQRDQMVEATIADGNGYDSNKVRYEWIVDGVTRTDTEGRGYKVKQSDYGKDIKVHVTYIDNDGNSEDGTSNALQVEADKGNNPATGVVTVTGDGTVGTSLTATHGLISDTDGVQKSVYSYKWYSVGSDGARTQISSDHYQGNDSSKLVVTSDLLGKDIKAELNFTDDLGHPEAIASARVVAPILSAQFDVTRVTLSFTGVTAPANPPTPKMLLVDSNSSLYILDVNGDGVINRSDATTYITNLDANGSIAVPTSYGHVRATLLGKDDNKWTGLDFTKAVWGTATGAKGVTGNSAASDVAAKDFWTATAADNGASHYVWTSDASGPYTKANNSFTGDPNRMHYNLFEVKFNTGAVLPG